MWNTYFNEQNKSRNYIDNYFIFDSRYITYIIHSTQNYSEMKTQSNRTDSRSIARDSTQALKNSRPLACSVNSLAHAKKITPQHSHIKNDAYLPVSLGY